MKRAALKNKAAKAKLESKYIDFKESIDVDVAGDWCEVIKDLVAMANSGGGAILFGVANNGRSVRFDGGPLLTYDPAKITDKIARYTQRQFADFEIDEVRRGRSKISAIFVESAGVPMVFTRAGTYKSGEKERIAFQLGSIYFRHGAKSEPSTPADLDETIERLVDERRKRWLENVKKVSLAPHDAQIIVTEGSRGGPPTPPLVGHVAAGGRGVGMYPAEADKTWPHRGKAVIERVRKRLPRGVTFNSYDIQALHGVFSLEEEHPEFVYRPFLNASPQFSDAFIEWLVEEATKDHKFFARTRARHRG